MSEVAAKKFYFTLATKLAKSYQYQLL